MISCIEEGRRKRLLLNALKENTPEKIKERYEKKVKSGEFLEIKPCDKNTDGLDLTDYNCIKKLNKRGYTFKEIIKITGFKRYTIQNVMRGKKPKKKLFKGRLLGIKCIECLKLISYDLSNNEIMNKINVTRASLNGYRNKYKDIINKLREENEINKG